MSAYTSDLLLALARPLASGELAFSSEDTWLVAKLNARFPFSGAKIDWHLLPDHRSPPASKSDRDVSFLAFLAECEPLIGGGTKAFYLNDNMLDGYLVGKFSTLIQHMDSILEMPAHHYVLGSDFGWVIAYTFEGDIDFGKAPVPTS